MTVAVVTGSAGLVGSMACKQLADKGYFVVGIDNFLRGEFFGEAHSTLRTETALRRQLGNEYVSNFVDVRDRSAISAVFSKYRESIQVVVHAAGQPSHDWSAMNPSADFEINATGTLNLLEATRQYCPDSVFIFMSSNKVYGDAVNLLEFVELETRFELTSSEPCFHGISETMSVDRSLHSVFGVSKLAADLMVQEYGRNFGLKSVSFRAGTITGAVALHLQAYGALNGSPGTRAYYDAIRARGTGHHAALRQVANRLVGILHGCLETGTLYHETVAWNSSASVTQTPWHPPLDTNRHGMSAKYEDPPNWTRLRWSREPPMAPAEAVNPLSQYSALRPVRPASATADWPASPGSTHPSQASGT